jgi:hypothetical protein
VSVVRQATSRKAREVAHPQLFRSMLKGKPALYFLFKWPAGPQYNLKHLEVVAVEVSGFWGRAVTLALRAWTTPVLQVHVDRERVQVSFLPPRPETSGIDDRLAQIDQARESLGSALSAVDDLRAAAERNKNELRDALERIGQARAEKAVAEKQLESVKQIAQADVEVFKNLAGIPSRAQIARERFIGFIIGVVASLIASGILWALVRAWEHFKK